MSSWLKWLPSALAVLAIALFLRLPLGTTASPSATIVVTDTGQDDPTDPNRDTNGTCTLNEAIRAANTDTAVDACPAGSGADTIQLSGTTYTLSYMEGFFDGNNGSPHITSPITIQGVAGSTVIRRASGAEDPFRLLQVRSDGILIVTDLTLRDGVLEGFGGAAIDVRGGVLTVTNVLLTNNQAPYGGAIANSNGEIWIAESEFTENTAPFTDTNVGHGGALYSAQGIVHAISTTFATNSAYDSGGAIYSYNGAQLWLALVNVTANIANADSVGGGSGGGIYNNADLNIAGGEISTNQVLPSVSDPWDGGGIWSGGDTVITGTVITTNSAGNGAGLFQQSGDAFVDFAIITDNAAADEGGGIWNQATLHVTDSNVATNAAGSLGGGIVNRRRLFLRNSTVAANAAGSDGGGVAEMNATQSIGTSVVNSTISDNTAAGNGGGLFVGTDGRLLLANATVANNTANSGATLFNEGAVTNAVTRNSILYASGTSCNAPITSQGYNVENGASCGLVGVGDQNADPLLGPLAVNGGPTLTHALLQGSPAVDAGDPTGCTDDDVVILTEDQRGSLRPIDGNNDLDPRCDAGAFEAPAGTGATVTPTPTNTATATATVATNTPTPTATATATTTGATSTPTATATTTGATSTPTATATATTTGATSTPTATATATTTGATSTPTATATATTTGATSTPTATATATTTGATSTPTATATATTTGATSTPTATATATTTGATSTPTATATATTTGATSTPTATATATTTGATSTPTATATATTTGATSTPTATATLTPSPTSPPTGIELSAFGTRRGGPDAAGMLLTLCGVGLVALGLRRRVRG